MHATTTPRQNDTASCHQTEAPVLVLLSAAGPVLGIKSNTENVLVNKPVMKW